MALNHSSYVIDILDYDMEKTTVQVNGPPILADGTNYAAVYAAALAAANAIKAIILGTVVGEKFIATSERFEKVRPSSKAAQRETRLFVSGEDTNFQPRHITIGTFDTEELELLTDDDVSASKMDLSVGNGATLRLALEAYWTSQPGYQETVDAVSVKSAVHVGANT